MGIGTAHPVRVLAAAPDARWAVLCEARADTDQNGVIAVGPGFNGIYGDQMEAFLVMGSGPGAPIDDLIDSDPTGRYLVILRENKLVLVDTIGGSDVDLSALGAYDSLFRDQATGAYLGVSFDEAGSHLSYVATAKQAVVVKVRDLSRGDEVTLDPGPGKLWSAKLDAGGHVELEMLVAHGQRPIAFPSHREPGLQRFPQCMTRTSSDVVEERGDTPILRIAPITGGPAVDAPGFLVALQGATLQRTPTGALTIEDATGTHELLPAACQARVDGIDAVHRRVLAHCATGGELLAEVGSKKEISPFPRSSRDDYFGPFGRHVRLPTNDANYRIYDVETGTVRVDQGQSPVSMLGSRTLGTLDLRLILLDGAQEIDLGAIESRYPTVLAAGTIRFLDPLVVDLGTGKLVGRAPTREMPLSPELTLDKRFMVTVTATVMAVATDGRLLCAFTTKPSGYPDGPLEWLAPAPP